MPLRMRNRVIFALLPLVIFTFAFGLSGCFFGKKKEPAPAAVTGPADPTAPGVAAAPAPPAQPKKRGVIDRILNPFYREPKDPSSTVSYVRGVEFTVLVDDPTPSLAEKRQVQVTVRAVNHEKSMVNLTFTSTQRIEIIARAPEGKIISTWSEDRKFDPVYNVITINPGERIEYSEAVPTRDMAAGRTYTIEASMIGQVGLSGTATVMPRP
jgi:Intracellular proteinase inhibitor